MIILCRFKCNAWGNLKVFWETAPQSVPTQLWSLESVNKIRCHPRLPLCLHMCRQPKENRILFVIIFSDFATATSLCNPLTVVRPGWSVVFAYSMQGGMMACSVSCAQLLSILQLNVKILWDTMPFTVFYLMSCLWKPHTVSAQFQFTPCTSPIVCVFLNHTLLALWWC